MLSYLHLVLRRISPFGLQESRPHCSLMRLLKVWIRLPLDLLLHGINTHPKALIDLASMLETTVMSFPLLAKSGTSPQPYSRLWREL